MSWAQAHNVTWKIFYSDNPWGALFFHNLRQPENKHRVRPIEELWGDISSGDLPQYTFIEPRMSTSARGPSNWQHPDNSVEAVCDRRSLRVRAARPQPVGRASSC